MGAEYFDGACPIVLSERSVNHSLEENLYQSYDEGCHVLVWAAQKYYEDNPLVATGVRCYLDDMLFLTIAPSEGRWTPVEGGSSELMD